MDRCKELEEYLEEYRICRRNLKKSILEEKYTLLISSLFTVLDGLIQEHLPYGADQKPASVGRGSEGKRHRGGHGQKPRAARDGRG